MPYVYVYFDVDNTPIYVGVATSKYRYRAHWKVDTRLGRTLRKREKELGICLFPTMIECAERSIACFVERFFISHYGRQDLGLGTLYNLTDGGDGMSGHKPSEITRQKLSRPCREDTKKKISIANKGNKAMLGRKHSVEAREKMKQPKLHLRKSCTVDGIVIYPSLKDLTNALGKGKDGSRNPNFRYI